MINNYESFKKEVYFLTNIDLNAYKERQMKRRIDSLIKKNSYENYNDYIKAIKNNKDLFEEFINYLTINVSEFYRNPEQWRVLEEEILPHLFNIFGKKLKIWSAACSTGDEPYSLAMLLSKYIPLSNVEIIATDIDKQVLNKAKIGLYHEKNLAALPEEYKNKYFKKISATSYQITDDIKSSIKFKQHNLLKDPYPNHCNLIVCRNVLIYFTEEAKVSIYKKFNQALQHNGILFVGSTEQIINPKRYELNCYKSFYYQKDNELE
ncbi:MAG: CheR family methyltransferase [Eubacteriales bacterium]